MDMDSLGGSGVDTISFNGAVEMRLTIKRVSVLRNMSLVVGS